MTDPTDATAAGTGTTVTAAAATSVPGTTQATTGAATDGTATATTGGTATNAPAAQTGTESAAPPLDTIISGLKTLSSEVINLNLPSLSINLVLTLADASKATLGLYLTPPAPASTSGTAPKGGSLDDVLGSVRTAVNDSATFGETMLVEQGYSCVTSLQRT